MRKRRSTELEEDDVTDHGVIATKVSTPPNRRRSPLVHFFVTLWTRVKFLFTTAIAEACECSVPAKSRSFHGNSQPCKELDHENCQHELAPGDRSQPNLNTVAGSPVDWETADHNPTPSLNRELSAEKFNEVACTANTKFVSPLMRELSTPQEHFHEMLDEMEGVNLTHLVEVHLEPVELSFSPGDNLVSGIVTFAQPILLTSVAHKTHSTTPLTLVEKSLLAEVQENLEELDLGSEVSPASINSSSEVFTDYTDNSSVPLTTLSRLHSRMQNGELSVEEHADLVSRVMQSTLPRNLSDTPETRITIEANKLYAWQHPPTLFNADWDEDCPNEAGEVTDTLPFVDSLISDAVETVSRETSAGVEEIEEEPTPSTSTGIHHQSPPKSLRHSFAETEVPRALFVSEISYDGIQSTSLDRVRSANGGINMRSKRSSSLKSGRSPSRKIVRFADSLGLDLTTTRQVKDQDFPPQIPASATVDLHLESEKSLSSVGVKQFQICFAQPGSASSFMHRVLTTLVSLENARVDSSRGLLTGTVRVKSVGFEKRVVIRLTYNNWATFNEVPAAYVQDSHDGATDRFSFSAVFPNSMVADDKAQFAVRYEIHTGEVHWDNNHGENYQIMCYAKSTDIAGDGSWIHYV